MQESLQFSEVYGKAGSPAEAQRVIDQYSYLFQDNRPSPQIALTFSSNGEVSLSADGKPLTFG
jgi:phosphoheptose isomerase